MGFVLGFFCQLIVIYRNINIGTRIALYYCVEQGLLAFFLNDVLNHDS